MAYYMISEIGPKRFGEEPSDLDKIRMEDTAFADPDKRIFIVADGLTSVSRVRGLGKQASQTAVKTVYDFLKHHDSMNERILRMAVSRANGEVARGTGGYGGTTLEVVVARYEYAYYAHLGDSRIYHATNKKAGLNEKRTRQITVDDHDGTGQTNFIGVTNPEIHTGRLPLKNNDLLILCSDGIHNYVDQNVFQRMLKSDYSADKIAKEIVKSTQEEMTAWDRKTDNFSIIVYRHEIPRFKQKTNSGEKVCAV